MSYFHFDSHGDVITSDVITKQWQLQCVDINNLYNISCYDRKENVSHCTYLYHCLSRSLCEKRLSCEKRMSSQRRMTAMRRTLRSATLSAKIEVETFPPSFSASCGTAPTIEPWFILKPQASRGSVLLLECKLHDVPIVYYRAFQ